MKDRLSKEAVASTVWQRLFNLIIVTAPERDALIRQLVLTPAESRALTSLDPTRTHSMRSLSREWDCDPSNATWLVDRLEKRGLAVRGSVEGDRRVKSVALTLKGARIRAKLLEAFFRPPRRLVALSREDLEAMRDATATLPPPPQWVR